MEKRPQSFRKDSDMMNVIPNILNIMKKLLLLLTMLSLFPQMTYAADLEISGWLPYWAASKGIKDARQHLDQLTELNPFTLVVTKDGEVKDLGNMKKSTWTKLFKEAKKKKIEVIPTLMWSDTANIHDILSDPDKREDHIDSIVSFVKKGKYDGIDIDYEGKRSETKPYFSAFLTELKK